MKIAIKKRKRVEFETQDGKEVFLKEKLAKYAKTLTYALNESVVSINDEENRNPFPAASIAFFRFKQLLKVEKKVKEQSYDSPERCTLKLAEDVKEFLRRGFSFEELVNLAKASDYFDTDCFLPVIDYMSDYLKEKSRSVRYDFNQLRENNRIEETLKEKIKKVVVGKYPKSSMKVDIAVLLSKAANSTLASQIKLFLFPHVAIVQSEKDVLKIDLKTRGILPLVRVSTLQSQFTQFVFSPNGTRIIGNAHGKLVRWNAMTGEKISEDDSENDPKSYCTFLDDTNLVICHHGIVQKLNLDTQTMDKIRSFPSYARSDSYVCSSDGSVIANVKSNPDSERCFLYPLMVANPPKRMKKIKLPLTEKRLIQFNGSGSFFIVGENHGKSISWWDSSTGKKMQNFENSVQSLVLGMAVSQDNSMVGVVNINCVEENDQGQFLCKDQSMVSLFDRVTGECVKQHSITQQLPRGDWDEKEDFSKKVNCFLTHDNKRIVLRAKRKKQYSPKSLDKVLLIIDLETGELVDQPCKCRAVVENEEGTVLIGKIDPRSAELTIESLFNEKHFNNLTLEQLLLLQALPTDGKIVLTNKEDAIFKSLPSWIQALARDSIYFTS